MKYFKHNDIFAGIIMTIVFVAIIALIGIGGGHIYKSTSYGCNQIKVLKAQKYAIKNYKNLKVYKKD